MTTCPFCEDTVEAVFENEFSFAIRDRYPVSDGHMLIISKRHLDDYFELTRREKRACWELVDRVKQSLEKELNPDGWNIGINTGKAAGQTVFHVHIHLIPRCEGDVDDPRGGVRNTIPGMGDYG
ncbi:MAG: HIT family protein [Balneolaceae bacterium]